MLFPRLPQPKGGKSQRTAECKWVAIICVACRRDQARKAMEIWAITEGSASVRATARIDLHGYPKSEILQHGNSDASCAREINDRAS